VNFGIDGTAPLLVAADPEDDVQRIKMDTLQQVRRKCSQKKRQRQQVGGQTEACTTVMNLEKPTMCATIWVLRG